MYSHDVFSGTEIVPSIMATSVREELPATQSISSSLPPLVNGNTKGNSCLARGGGGICCNH